jgi:hypothetical protein
VEREQSGVKWLGVWARRWGCRMHMFIGCWPDNLGRAIHFRDIPQGCLDQSRWLFSPCR